MNGLKQPRRPGQTPTRLPNRFLHKIYPCQNIAAKRTKMQIFEKDAQKKLFARPAFSFIFAKVSRNTLKIHLNRKKVHLLLLSLSTLKKLKNEPICPLGSRIKKGESRRRKALTLSDGKPAEDGVPELRRKIHSKR